MSNPCGCKDSESMQASRAVIVQQITECQATVNETVCVQAEVTITPEVTTGEVSSFCLGEPFIGACPGTLSPTGTCTFNVSQSICVQVPLTFAATANAEPTGIVCGIPGIGECPITIACTRTIGFYRNNPEVTNALITEAGGSIVLGINGQGASFTVTTANANNVLSFNTPSPPAPNSPPFAGQYQVLYAQLLAANLNVLSGATCDFALDAIAAANLFLANSPSCVGMAGAPIVQEPLAEFNEGRAPGCPGLCPEE